ncbi:hemagglutinin repeat-containing protein [Pandoraea pulmonicola]|uniref:Filamentous hemagglutinin n=1 Tax=Pandoraea pulmonicola TaxID=93221 RepID=A0AAJ4ZB67_PANPU|nr:hemagglutinin repeat-containing protein [Pandoraea pulmonicola]APD13349.1 hypothetical protein RO07_13800 [Pandoraea pulmonicola]SUA90001.1 Filamentous hemagglutinin [Pandoraea pulmonicola]
MAHVVIAAIVAQPLATIAQIVADPNAGANRPGVIQTQNGLPQVNITAPSAGGVSQNLYSQFDVPRQGAILNNSATIAQTQQAGLVAGNPNLAQGQSARIILNQVTGNLPSQIRGYLEVAGNRAEVIVANGNGIVVDGGGFINTSRGILTTGAPIFGADGTLNGFQVSRGTIAVQGGGLNAGNVDQIDLIARAVSVNASIYGNRLNVVTGANRVDHDTLNASADTSTGAAPGVALDVGQLGGMYANRIFLVGTENGVGVSNNGIIAAQAGELTLRTNGDLVQSGKLMASGDLAASAKGAVDNRGSLYARGTVSVGSDSTLSNSGTIAGAGDVTLNARNVQSSGSLGAGVDERGAVTNAGRMAVNALAQARLSGLATAGSDIALRAASADLRDATITATDVLTLDVSGGTDTRRATLTADRLGFTVGSLNNAGGHLRHIGTGKTFFSVAGTLDNTSGEIRSNGGDMTVSAATLTNEDGALAHAGIGNLSVTAGALSNRSGTITSNGDIDVGTTSLDNTAGTLTGGKSVTANALTTLSNRGGRIESAAQMRLTSGGLLDNTSGQLQSNGRDFTVSAGSLTNDLGNLKLSGGGVLTLTSGVLSNRSGAIASNGDATIKLASLDNHAGSIVSGKGLSLSARTDIANDGGLIQAVSALTASAGGVLNNTGGRIEANDQNATLDVSGNAVDNSSGRIVNAGVGATQVSATGTLTNQDAARTTKVGIIGGKGDVTITAGTFANGIGGQTAAGRDLNVQVATGAVTNAGTFTSANQLRVRGASIMNDSAGGMFAKTTTLNAINTLTNTGRLEGDTLDITAGAVNNVSTIIGNNVTLRANSITNTGASAVIGAASELSLYAAGTLTNQSQASLFSIGKINIAGGDTRDASGYLTRRTASVLNDQSSIEAGTGIEIAADSIVNRRPAPTAVTQSSGPQVQTLTKRDKYIGCATMNASKTCPQSLRDEGYNTPLNVTFSNSSVVSKSDGPNAVDRVIVVNSGSGPRTLYYNSVTDNGNGTVTVNYWDAYDPHVNYDPGTEFPTRSDGHKGYQRVEISREVTTNSSEDVISGGAAPKATLIAGGNLVMRNVGSLTNEHSAIAAGGNIVIGNTSQSGAVDSGSIGGTTVTNIGQTLYRRATQDIVSTYSWNEGIGSDMGTIVQAPVVVAPVAIGSTGGTIVAGGSVTIDAKNVTNTNTGAGAGSTLGANASGVTVTGKTWQTVAGPTGQLNLKLPTNGLYSLRTAPGQPYLIVTDPRLTQYASFVSSDYLLQQIGFNPQTSEKRLGDGLYEQQQVRDQITQMTGRTYLQGYNNAEAEYRDLMTNGANYAKQFGLVPGVGLTAAQMDALTSDIVWLVSQNVTLPDGTSTQVLAPVVYLAKPRAGDLQPSGALIAGNDIQVHASGSLANSGVIKAGTNTLVEAGDVINRSGTITSGGAGGDAGTTRIVAANDIINASGEISGDRVAVLAGRDVVNTTDVDLKGMHRESGNTQVTTSLLGKTGTIASTGDLAIGAGRDLTVRGGAISAGGDAQIIVGRDLKVDTVQVNVDQSMHQNDAHHWEESTTLNKTSSITTGGTLSTTSVNDTTLSGAQITAGKGASILAGGDLNISAAKDTATRSNVAADSASRQEVSHGYDERTVGSSISSGGAIVLAASNQTDATKGNVTVTGSTVTSGTDATTKGGITVVASGNVVVQEARERHDSDVAVDSKRGSFVSGTQTSSAQQQHVDAGVASTLSGDTVTVKAANDLTVQGSNIVGTNDVTLSAGRNVTITTSEDRTDATSSFSQRESGFMSNGGLSFSIGSRSQSDDQRSSQVTHTGSLVGSVDGNLTVKAGETLHVTGSTLHAGNDVNLAGKSVTIDAAHDTFGMNEKQSFQQSGLTIGFTNPILAAVQATTDVAKSASRAKGDARLLALAGATAGLAVANAADTIAKDPKEATSVGINVSLGASRSNSETTSQSSTAAGSRISGNRNVNITASGGGADSDLSIVGSQIKAGQNALLSADGDVNIQAAQNTSSQHSNNSGTNASLGVSFTVGSKSGISFNAGVSGNRGNADGDDVAWSNSHVQAGDKLTIKSGADTTLRGAVVEGRQVVANVGGNLTVESLQDTSRYDSKQQSAGVSASVCVPPLCAGGSSIAGNIGQQKLNSDYASVIEQTGIRAGSGGFQIDVKGNTGLVGGVIASNDEAVANGSNRLTTGTLTHSDIENHASYSGSQVGLGGGFGTSIGKDREGKADNVNPIAGTELPRSSGGASINMPVVMGASGSASGTTRSGISGGALTVRDSDAQRKLTGETADEAVANVNRDTSNTNGSVEQIFDKEKIQAGFEIVGQFINQVNTLVTNKAREADDLKARREKETDPEKQAQLDQQIAEAQKWAPGGEYRRIVTAISIGVGGNVAGGMGEVATNTMVSYLQSLGAEQVKRIADNLGSEPARVALQAIVGCAGSAASGGNCGAGALGASASVVLNNLLDGANGKSGEDLSVEEKENRTNLITGIVAGIAGVAGTDVVSASAGATIETVNNALTLSEFKLLIQEAKGCERTNTCEQVRDKYRALSAANQEKLVATCAADPKACQGEFGSYLAELSDFRKTLDAAVGEKLPSTIKNDLGIYLLHYNDAVAAVNEPELAKQFKEKFGISQELAQTVAAVAAGIAGSKAGGKYRGAQGGGNSNATNTPSALQQVKDLFSSNAQGTIQIGESTFTTLPKSGNAAIFSGVTDAQVQQYFMKLSGASQMPAARTISGQGTIYVVKTPQGNFTLRDFAGSSSQTGSVWTIDVPGSAVGKTYNPEIKFLR